MRSDFKRAATFLVPNCPAKRQKKKNRNPTASVGVVCGDQHRGKTTCKRGTPEVELRWRNSEDFNQLSKPQKQELYAFNRTERKNGHGGRRYLPTTLKKGGRGSPKFLSRKSLKSWPPAQWLRDSMSYSRWTSRTPSTRSKL